MTSTSVLICLNTFKRPLIFETYLSPIVEWHWHWHCSRSQQCFVISEVQLSRGPVSWCHGVWLRVVELWAGKRPVGGGWFDDGWEASSRAQDWRLEVMNHSGQWAAEGSRGSASSKEWKKLTHGIKIWESERVPWNLIVLCHRKIFLKAVLISRIESSIG